MKTKLQDLNEYMFECLNRLTNDDLNNEQLMTEIDRSNAVAKVAEVIIKNGELAMKAYAIAQEAGVSLDYPRLLG